MFPVDLVQDICIRELCGPPKRYRGVLEGSWGGPVSVQKVSKATDRNSIHSPCPMNFRRDMPTPLGRLLRTHENTPKKNSSNLNPCQNQRAPLLGHQPHENIPAFFSSPSMPCSNSAALNLKLASWVRRHRISRQRNKRGDHSAFPTSRPPFCSKSKLVKKELHI